MSDVDPRTQTAVMDALPHAIHPMHETWRDKADALIAGLASRGYVIRPTAVVPVTAEEQQ